MFLFGVLSFFQIVFGSESLLLSQSMCDVIRQLTSALAIFLMARGSSTGCGFFEQIFAKKRHKISYTEYLTNYFSFLSG